MMSDLTPITMATIEEERDGEEKKKRKEKRK